MAVDTACSSSLVAFDQACRAVLGGTSASTGLDLGYRAGDEGCPPVPTAPASSVHSGRSWPVNGGSTRRRRSCPFAAGVLTTAASVELVVVAGTTLVPDPARRHFAGVTALIAGLLSLVGADLDGFLLGFLLAIAGSALALARVPDRSPAS